MSRATALLDRLRANADFVFAAVLVAMGAQAEAWSGQVDDRQRRRRRRRCSA